MFGNRVGGALQISIYAKVLNKRDNFIFKNPSNPIQLLDTFIMIIIIVILVERPTRLEGRYVIEFLGLSKCNI